jgi:hypothetical protein
VGLDGWIAPPKSSLATSLAFRRPGPKKFSHLPPPCVIASMLHHESQFPHRRMERYFPIITTSVGKF